MTQDRDIERLIDHWLADGPTQASDRVFDEAVARINRQSQRPAWLLRRERPMSSLFKVALGAASVVLVVSGLVLVIRPGGPSVATNPPPPSPATSPSLIPSLAPSGSPIAVRCDDPAFGCAGALTAGSHASTAFQPAFTFVVPAGWTNPLDRARAYTLRPPGDVFFFQVLSEVAIPEQNADCSPAKRAGVGSGVADWVEFLTAHPGLVTATPTPVSIGGHTGSSVSFHVAAAWTATCPRSIGPAVAIMTDSGTTPDRMVWIDDQFTTFTIIDVAGTTVVIRLESGPRTSDNERDQATVQPILSSMQFELGPGASGSPSPSEGPSQPAASR